MLIVAPDFDRRIDLPGVGPCPRPVDIDQGVTGLDRLVSLRIYSFARGSVIDGEAEADEVFVTLLRGAADVAVMQDGRQIGDFALRRGATCAVYLPPHAAYRLTAREDCDIAYARVREPASGAPAAAGFATHDGAVRVPSHAAGMQLVLERLAPGEALDGADAAPERFLHVRSDDGGVGVLSGTRLADWQTAVLGDGERVTLTADGGHIDILQISATTH